MNHALNLLLIAAGGALGALLRYGAAGLAHRWLGESFPWGTLTVNLIGSYVIGLLWTFSEETALPAQVRPLVFVGVLGAFTTFSTYTLESINLLRDGEVGLGLANLAGSNLLGLCAVVLGIWTARLFLPPGR